MSHADYVHLHLHTEYSLLDGACRLDRLMEKAHELKFPAMAITDHGVMYGAIDFYQQARDKGIKPIIGCEVYVAPGSRLDKKTSSGGRDVYHHLVLLAKDERGYQNLVKLVTAAHLEGYYYKPRIDKEILAAHKDGLIALSGCLASEVPELILKDQFDKAREAIDWFKQTFGAENYYLELQNHGIIEQAKVNRYLVPWAKEFGLKLVATNDVHYVEKGHSHAHDCLICIGTQTQLSDPKRMKYVEQQFYLRSADEMKALFPDHLEAVLNTREVAEKCNVEIEFGKLHYPAFTPPETFTREGFLRKLVVEGLQARYGLCVRVEGQEFIVESIEDARRLPTFVVGQASSLSGGTDESTGDSTIPKGATSVQTGGTPVPLHQQPAVAAAIKDLLERLQLELGVIEKTGFISYFLIVGDFIRYGRSKGISCVARGSAAGSLVTYLLEISNVDPIRYNLLFERFLNPERVNPPDIDIDFADDRRADVIQYVREKYGHDSVAQIITFGTMGAKSVVRDMGRVMGLSYSECDRLAKMVPGELGMSLKKALQQSPEFKQAYDSEEITRELLDTAFVLEDLTRNASVHAAGVVIGSGPLVELLPLKKDEDGAIVTQYAMGPVGDLGLLKMDFLGLKTLTVIRNTCEMVKATRGLEVPIDNLPLDDAKTYQILNKAQTVGVFQLESGGMRDLCRKFQISSIEHITALIALYRPGPMELIPEFIARRHGQVKIEYAHPLLEPISRETYGVLIYQEQVMQAAQVLAGYTLGGADLLRRAMGKKKAEEMAKQRESFVKGCAKVNNIPAAKANHIFDLLEKFAGYGFNKSHAAAYAIVAYQTAYLKANYPVEFLSAMLTNDMGDTAKVSILIQDAKAFGVEVLAPDVNESRVHFAPGVSGTGRPSGTGILPVQEQGILPANEAGGPSGPRSSPSPAPTPLPFTAFDKQRPASIRSRNLPHWRQEGVTYFVTFRLADSLPRSVYETWRRQRDEALSSIPQDPGESASRGESAPCQDASGAADKTCVPETEGTLVAQAATLSVPSEALLQKRKTRVEEEFRERLEGHLDEGYGECRLKNPQVSSIVENALRHFDGERYALGSYVIMPNHVHVLVRPLMNHTLSEILHSWKSFTAKEANQALLRTGEFWQDESFDHIVRDEHGLENFACYIEANPRHAGLREGEFRMGGGTACREVTQASGLKHPDVAGKMPAAGTGGTPVPLPVPLAVPPRPIRFGLAAIKGVGEIAVASILKAREDGGRFQSLSDLCERVDSRAVGRKTLESLIKGGACDSLGSNRATMFGQIDRVLARAQSLQQDKQRGQSSLFGMLADAPHPMAEANHRVPEWPQSEMLAAEKELLGFYVTGHPLTPFAPILEKYSLVTTMTAAQLPNRTMTRLGGMITTVQNGFSKKSNKPYAMVTLEDLEGSVQMLVMNEAYDKYLELLVPNKAVLVIGEVSNMEDKPKIFPQEIIPLEDAARKFTKQVHLRLHTAHLTPERLQLAHRLSVAHAGKCPLFLCLMQPTGEIVFIESNERFFVTPSLQFQRAVDEAFGEETYYARVDTSPPERTPRRWERRENGAGEE